MNILRLPFEGPIKGFSINFIHKNKWRLKGYLNSEDILFEAYKIYAECLERYGSKVDSPEWFMSLFKTSFINYFNAASTYATFLERFYSMEDLIENFDLQKQINFDMNKYIGVDRNLGELMVKISQAPEDVINVIEFLLNDSDENNAFEEVWKNQGKKKIGGNEYICRALGFNPKKVDLVSMVYDYFLDEN